MESAHPFSVSFAPCFQAVLCRSRLFFRMFLDKLFQICADRFIMKQKRRCFSPFLQSPSSRRAWIEIRNQARPATRGIVALLAEGVDRNFFDRAKAALQKQVALLAEGVDRNDCPRCTIERPCRSPSSRRAWIEIMNEDGQLVLKWVALLAEGVDRNSYRPYSATIKSGRPPRGGRG